MHLPSIVHSGSRQPEARMGDDEAILVDGARLPSLKPLPVGKYAPFPAAYATAKHLWRSAGCLLSRQPHISTLLSRALIRASATSLTDLGTGVEEMLCKGCGAILLPGSTARVRIHHRDRDSAANRRRRRGGVKGKGTGQQSGGKSGCEGEGGSGRGGIGRTLRNEIVYTCLQCRDQRRSPGAARQGAGGERGAPVKAAVAAPQAVARAQEEAAGKGKKRAAPEGAEEFISLGAPAGGDRQERQQLRPLDSKPRKRKKKGGGDGEGPGGRGPAGARSGGSSSLESSLGDLKSMFSSFHQQK